MCGGDTERDKDVCFHTTDGDCCFFALSTSRFFLFGFGKEISLFLPAVLLSFDDVTVLFCLKRPSLKKSTHFVVFECRVTLPWKVV